MTIAPALRRYLGPTSGYAFLAMLPFLPWPPLPVDGLFLGVAFALAYIAVSLWWIASASEPAKPRWPHLLAIWAPAILPVWSAIETVRAMAAGDNGAMAAFFTFPIATMVMIICAVGAIRLVLQR